MEYKLAVGLEIHVELKTRTKMFCACLNDSAERHPNINICPICMGHPGTLPVINKRAVENVLRVGLALGGKIPDYSHFDRKNYFYPDLPKGYQISQYKYPLVNGGALILPGSDRKIGIIRVHLEEDTGRLLHDGVDSLVDFNRAGVPLMELVTEPDIFSAIEARAFAEEFQLLLRYLGVSDADMEKGQMRVEANISLGGPAAKLGVKVEIKNLNSFRAVERAIEYENERQEKILKEGGKITQETRGWDENKQKTFSQRIKEEAHDYRYFPEPDLPSLNLTKKEDFDLDALKAALPELPWQKRERLAKEYNLKGDALLMAVRDNKMADFLEKSVSELSEWIKDHALKEKDLIKLAINYITSDLQALIKEKEGTFSELLITPENFAELMKMVIKNEISSRAAKDVLLKMFLSGGDPSEIVESGGLRQINDEFQLKDIIESVVKDNPGPVAEYGKGKETALQFLIGRVVKKTHGRANPLLAVKILREYLRKL
ncbi:MAG: Asp-tRNA(Asn)/Glu-tRNA(Gln) amidotransferase subunit GatB [Candidatus Niyogibacteria bacterium]|nr:Asp-tRNA(Asn)/Glu-tRNA(Gln) amidotransferase subunit GatB [Candidatus Niyogibacteria bacterium]